MSTRGVGLLATCVAATLVLSPAASAQRRPRPQPAQGADASAAPDATERARQLFEQGLASMERERWDEARLLFEEAWSLAPRPSILVNLGTAQRQSGRLVEARESYRTFLDRFPTHELAAQTQRSLLEVETLMPQLTIHVEGLEEGDEVFLDETPVEALDVPFAANPGLRQVSLWRGGRSLQSVRVRVELEGDEEVFLRAVDIAPSSVAAATVVGEGTAPGTTTPTPSGSDDTGLVVGLVIGAVLLVAGGVTLGVVLGTQEGPRAAVMPTIRGGVLVFE